MTDSRARRAAGTTGATADGQGVGGSDIGEQAREALRRIQGALQQAGAELAHVVRIRMYVTDITRRQKVGQAHGEGSEASSQPRPSSR